MFLRLSLKALDLENISNTQGINNNNNNNNKYNNNNNNNNNSNINNNNIFLDNQTLFNFEMYTKFTEIITV